jgi:predicted SAM-dependent methyltransferase
LPFGIGEVSAIHSAHLLEHFPQEALIRRILPHWFDLIKPGGRLSAIVPDGKAMVSNLSTGIYSFTEFREVLFGAQDYVGDYHFNLFTGESLAAILRTAGFVNVQIPTEGRRNGACYELEIVAEKPGPIVLGPI